MGYCLMGFKGTWAPAVGIVLNDNRESQLVVRLNLCSEQISKFWNLSTFRAIMSPRIMTVMYKLYIYIIYNRRAKDHAHIFLIPSVPIFPFFLKNSFIVLGQSFFRPIHLFSFLCRIHMNLCFVNFFETFPCPNNLLFLYLLS